MGFNEIIRFQGFIVYFMELYKTNKIYKINASLWNHRYPIETAMNFFKHFPGINNLEKIFN